MAVYGIVNVFLRVYTKVRIFENDGNPLIKTTDNCRLVCFATAKIIERDYHWRGM